MDTCDESTDTVVHVPNHEACANGVLCDGAEVCDAVSGCLAGPPVELDDGNPCTVDACDEEAGVTHVPDDAACDDLKPCNGLETCSVEDGCLAGDPPVCTDEDPCTDNLCDDDVEGGCTVQFNFAPCEDGDLCTAGDTCVSGSCFSGGPKSCDDSNNCCLLYTSDAADE